MFTERMKIQDKNWSSRETYFYSDFFFHLTKDIKGKEDHEIGERTLTSRVIRSGSLLTVKSNYRRIGSGID